MLGPGVVWAAFAQGSGELIWWPYLTAKYGTALLGLVVPACLMQLWVSVEVGRYTLNTGETLFAGLERMSRVYAAFLWLGLLCVSVWFGAYASAGGTSLAELTGFPPGWSPRGRSLFWACATIALFFSILLFSPVVYQWVEKIMWGVAGLSVAGVLAAIWYPEVFRVGGRYFRALATPPAGLPPQWDPSDTSVLLTALAFAGMGGYFNFLYSYWLHEKRAGMAHYMGRVTSPITGEAEESPDRALLFEDSPENRGRHRRWIRYLWVDNLIGVGVNLVTVVLMCWLALALLHPKGLVPKGWEIAVVQARFFSFAWGPVGKAVFLLIAAVFLADTWLTITDGMARMHADYLTSAWPGARRRPFRDWYYLWVILLTLLSLSTIWFRQPGPLITLVGVSSFLSMAVYAPGLIYLNYFRMPKLLPAWVRPHPVNGVILCGVTILYWALSVWYLSVIF
ncbi:MAG: Nramp family divalent metal transporter [Candidatus Tectomicrobia bacterium]|nr:Nramp family divalent metal transporter [Candidatus Tectomicrobia bacterium]